MNSRKDRKDLEIRDQKSDVRDPIFSFCHSVRPDFVPLGRQMAGYLQRSRAYGSAFQLFSISPWRALRPLREPRSLNKLAQRPKGTFSFLPLRPDFVPLGCQMAGYLQRSRAYGSGFQLWGKHASRVRH
jgi:hypothetical protein